MPSKSPGEAIIKRLLSESQLTPLVAARITPNLPEQEPVGPYIVCRRVSGGEGFTLDGGNRLKQYAFRIDVYADNDTKAEQILTIVTDRLCGNKSKTIAPWRDLADGVQICCPMDDLDADILQDASSVNGLTVSIWFAPQP